MIRRSGSGVLAFGRAVALLGVVLVGIPWMLIAAARSRFGGGSPLHGVPSPAGWNAGEIWQALTDRLTDQTVADVVIRCSLIVAWVAVGVLVITIIAETAHMVRHDGLPRPDIRGLGVPQSVARVVATGLLVVMPMFGPASKGSAVGLQPSAPEQPAAAADSSQVSTAARPENVGLTVADDQAVGQVGLSGFASSDRSAMSLPRGSEHYEVRPGDSIYGIAERLAGPDQRDVAEFAEQLIELNLGAEMPDGQRFTNAAYIDVGWVLELPPSGSGSTAEAASADAHVVESGESLWSIAEDEYGEGGRWPEIFEANEGRSFEDGRQFVDPDLIQPGWPLELPSSDDAEAGTEVVPESDQSLPARPDNVWVTNPAIDADSSRSVDTGDTRVDPTQTRSVEVGQDLANPVDPWSSDDIGADDRDGAPHEALPSSASRSAAPAGEADTTTNTEFDSEAPRLLTYTRAGMLSAGVLTLLAVRRRNQLRRARPRARLPEPAARPASTERALRAIDTGDLLSRLDVAIRSAAGDLIDQGGRVVAASIGADGELELRLSSAAALQPPWQGSAKRWCLASSTPLELLARSAHGVGSPCPTIVQLGRDHDGRDVYVELEACEAIEVGGPADDADSIVAAVASTLAGSVQAEVTTLVGLGVPDDAFLGHRLHVRANDSQGALESAREAVGSTAATDRSTFELRARGVAGEVWEPAVVLVGSAAGTIRLSGPHTGVAVVSASPIHGPSCRLAPDGDEWVLQPHGLRFQPIGVSPEDVAAIAELVEVDALVPDPGPHLDVDPDDTVVDRGGLAHGDHVEMVKAFEPTGGGDAAEQPDRLTEDGIDVSAADLPTSSQQAPSLPWSLLVRLLGPVDVVNASGESVVFERSKTRELVAWLATHRARSTRAGARTALWELDVRDATFANVVSEARRSLARLVEPPDGQEWVGRTLTEALPLHELVCSDVDLLEHALEAARVQPPAQAVATLSPAVELIIGMPFEGTSYLWPDPEGIASSLVLLATSATSELAAHCLSIGDIDGVFAATGRGLQVLPGHEELIGLRMQAHARAGDHAGVRHEWESYERVITADPWSDGEPSPKLVDLRTELLNPSRRA